MTADPPSAEPLPAAPRRTSWRALLLLATVLPIACWVVWESQRLFRADWVSAAERKQFQDAASSGTVQSSEREWNDALAAMQASVAITPDDPDMQESMGDLYFVASQRDPADEAQRTRYSALAATYYNQATVLRPSEPQTWAMLSASYLAAGENRARVRSAWAKALALGPFEGQVQPRLIQVVLADWDGASPDMQAWASSLFDRSDDATRGAINAIAARYGLKLSPDEGARP